MLSDIAKEYIGHAQTDDNRSENTPYRPRRARCNQPTAGKTQRSGSHVCTDSIISLDGTKINEGIDRDLVHVVKALESYCLYCKVTPRREDIAGAIPLWVRGLCGTSSIALHFGI